MRMHTDIVCVVAAKLTAHKDIETAQLPNTEHWTMPSLTCALNLDVQDRFPQHLLSNSQQAMYL